VTEQDEKFPTLASESESKSKSKGRVRQQHIKHGLKSTKVRSTNLKKLRASVQARQKQKKLNTKRSPKPKIKVTETENLTLEEKHNILVLYGGAAGGGKSYAMLADPLRYLSHPQFSGLLLRRTTEELRELVWKSQELYPKIIPGIKWSERKMQWTSPSGGRLWLSYLDRDDDVLRYQGLSFCWIGFDELTQWPTPFAWDYLRSRLRSIAPDLPVFMRATTNPGGAGHVWVKKYFVDPSPPGTDFWATDEDGNKLIFPTGHTKAGQPLFKRKFIPAKLFDNPYLAESGDYETMLLSLPENQRKRLLEGNWDVAEGAAFPEFNREVHVIAPFDIPKNWSKFRACDYGYGSYSAVLWFAVAPDGQLVVYRELYVSKVLAKDLANKVLYLEEADGTILYGVLDSSCWHRRGDTGPSLAEQMITQGCRWRPSDRSAGSRIAGKNEVHRRLQVQEAFGDIEEQPGIVFFHNCINLVSQLPSIPLDPKNPEDVNTKSEDHLYDALRYGIMSRPRKGIFDFTVEDMSDRYLPADATFGY
jgi:hypothetical protein